MFARDWILDVLWELELWYWPIFFWDMYWAERYYAAYRAANPRGAMGFGVTRQGRVILTLQVAGDRPDPNDWTGYAPRAPWARLDLQLLSSAFSGLNLTGQDSDGFRTVSGRDSDSVWTPLYLDPG